MAVLIKLFETRGLEEMGRQIQEFVRKENIRIDKMQLSHSFIEYRLATRAYSAILVYEQKE